MSRPSTTLFVSLFALILISGCRDEDLQRQFEDVSGDIGRYLAIDSEDPRRAADRQGLLSDIANELAAIRTEYPNTEQGRQIADDQPILGIRPSDLLRELTELQLCERDAISCAAMLSIETAQRAPEALPDAITALAAAGRIHEVEAAISLLDTEDRPAAIDAALEGFTVTQDWRGAERLVALSGDNLADRLDIIRDIVRDQAASDPKLAFQTLSTWVNGIPKEDDLRNELLESAMELYAEIGSAKAAADIIAILPGDRQFGALLQLRASLGAHGHDEDAGQIDDLVAARIAELKSVTARSLAWSRVAAARSKVAASGAIVGTGRAVASLKDVDIPFGHAFGADERSLPENDGELERLAAEDRLEAHAAIHAEALASGKLEQATEAAGNARDLALTGTAGPARDRELEQAVGMLAAVGEGYAAITAARGIDDVAQRAKTQAHIAVTLAARELE